MSPDQVQRVGPASDDVRRQNLDEALASARQALVAICDLYQVVGGLVEDSMTNMVIIDALIDSHPDPDALMAAHRKAVLMLESRMDDRVGLGATQKCSRYQARIAARLNGRTS